MNAPARARAATTAPERRPAGAPRHLRLVGDDESAAVRRRRGMRLVGVVAAASVIGLLFAAVYMHVVLAQGQFRLTHLDSEAKVAQTQYQQLRLQVDQLSSPSRILATAQGRLGMVAPAKVSYLNPSSSTAAATGISAATGGPAPATPPAGWSRIKPQLVASP